MELDHQELIEFENIYRQVNRRMAIEWNKLLAHPLNGSQVYMLEKLESEGPQKSSGLAEALGVTAGAVTGLSDKLIAAGLAERIRTDEDRRVVFLAITEHGRKTLETVRETRLNIRKLFFKDLPADDIRHLTRIYRDILSIYESHKDEPLGGD
ncbi:MarR family winged helix-turn-helix transcriptional regulator [Paenibacillus koleovorans]|uniref:MarR family winged helix-turn-helix transcriptional regulator n=1 Tax=Paenibacillus koleovorans TaxID=121608 RepID=UPI000FD7D2A7|nr:MarR family transcriptional regulator [Paenibacillus koleovorans]